MIVAELERGASSAVVVIESCSAAGCASEKPGMNKITARSEAYKAKLFHNIPILPLNMPIVSRKHTNRWLVQYALYAESIF